MAELDHGSRLLLLALVCDSARRGDESLTERILVDGSTPSGRTLVAYQDGDHPLDCRFVIDGEPADVLRRNLYRDGGTRKFETDRGVVIFPKRLMSDDRTPRLDGEPVA